MKKYVLYLALGLAAGWYFSHNATVEMSRGLTVVNDLQEQVRINYAHKNNQMSVVLPKNGQFNKAQGNMFIYVASKYGTYEVNFTFPRPAGSQMSVKMSEILVAAKQNTRTDDNDYYTEKGSIGDIEIFFESVSPFTED